MTPKFPCASPPGLCEQQTNPLTGFSSETDDSTTFIATAQSPNVPLLNKAFDVYPCQSIAESQLSQQEADLAAARAAVICANPCSAIFSNIAQTATALCDNGVPCLFTVPSGTFNALTQLEADRQAFSLAVATVGAHKICLGSLVNSTMCLGGEYSSEISAVGSDTPFTFELTTGSLPPGISMQKVGNQVIFSGVPTSTGAFPFTLRATNTVGVYSVQSVEIVVVNITTAAILPKATVGTPYSTAIILTNPASDAVQWSVISGSLPAGLTLNATTGAISGTPTAGGGTHTFTVQAVVDSATCSKVFSIESHFINWDAMVWSNILVVPGGAGFATGTFSGGTFSVSGKGNSSPDAKVEANGNLAYAGPLVNCICTVTVTAAGLANDVGFAIYQDGILKTSAGHALLTVGTHVFPFTIAATAGSTILVTGLIAIGDPAGLFIFESGSVAKAFVGVITEA